MDDLKGFKHDWDTFDINYANEQNSKRKEEMAREDIDFINDTSKFNLEVYKRYRKYSFKFKKASIKKITNHIVYIIWDELGENERYAKYVGRSVNGVSRLFEKTHKMAEHIHFSGELETIPCEDLRHSILLEKQLIKFLRPLYNIVYKSEKNTRVIFLDTL